MPDPDQQTPSPAAAAGRAARMRAAYDDMVAHLRRSGGAAGALAVGGELPPFLLPSWDGRLVSRDGLLAGGPVVLSFVRGQWCPYCRGELDRLRESLGAIRRAGGSLAVVTPEVGGRAAAMRRGMGLPFEVLCDVDNGLALACGLVFRLPDTVRAAYLEVGLDLAGNYGNGSWLLPIPATYLVDRGGIVRFAHVDEDFRERPDPATLVKALEDLGQG